MPGNQSRIPVAASIAAAYYAAALAVILRGAWNGHPLALAAVFAGLATGSLLVRRYSRIRLEIGWVGAGSLLTGFFCIAMGLVPAAPWSLAAAFGAGAAAAFCLQPLFALPRAASRALPALLGILGGAAVPAIPPSSSTLLVAVGVATLVFTLWLFGYENEFMIRSGLFLGGRVISGVHVTGQHHVPATGGALLVSNHVTFIDGFLIGSCLPRLVRYMIWKPYFEMPVSNWVCRKIQAIPMSETGPREVVAALRLAREKLLQGEVVCIFAEGSITRDGKMLPFKRGMERIVHGLDIPIVPVYLGGLVGRTLSFLNGKVVYRWPQWAHPPVTVAFGPALAAGSGAAEAQRAVAELAMAVTQSRGR